MWQIVDLIGQNKKMAYNCENNKQTTKKDVNSYGENSKSQVSVSINPINKTSLIETLSTEQQNLKRRLYDLV